MQSVVETRQYARRAADILSEGERDEVIAAIAGDPASGDLIIGTGGVRKRRFGRAGKGKSGGVRVIYYWHGTAAPIFLLDVFAKNEKANLSGREREQLAAAVAELKRELRATGMKG